MTAYLKLVSLLAISLLALAACEKAPDDHDGHDHGAHSEDDHADDPAHVEDGLDDHADDTPSATDEHDDHDDHEAIEISADALAEFGIEIDVAAAGTISNTVSLTGEVVLNPDRIAHVVSRADGIATEIVRSVGDRVVAGDLLAVVESGELAEAKAEYLARAAQASLAATDLARAETVHENTVRLLEVIAEDRDVAQLRSEVSTLDIGANRGPLLIAHAELRAAQAVSERERTLRDRQISSESEYFRAEADLDQALAAFGAARDDLRFSNRRALDAARRASEVAAVSLEASKRRLRALGLDEQQVDGIAQESDDDLARYAIRSPIDGLVIERHLVRGEGMERGLQVFVVADLSSVWAHLTLYQRDLPSVRVDQEVRIRGTHGLGDATVRIGYVSPILDENTRTTSARVVLDNPDGAWRPGMFINADVAVAQHLANVLVRASAPTELDGETVIFVETPHGLEPRDIVIGVRGTRFVEVLSGVEPGQRYVALGALALKAELDKSSLEHAGHAH